MARLQQALYRHFRRTLISGLLLLIPVALTYLIVRFLFDLIDGVLRPWMQWVLAQIGVHWTLPGPGILAAVLLLYLVGLIAAFSLGRWAVDQVRAMLLRVPFIGTIYSATRQLVESFSGSSVTGFKRVILVEFPKDNAWSLGFLTGLTDTEGSKKLVMAYIPTAPLPNSGFVVFFSPEDILDTDLTVPDAMQLVFSGGLVSPTSINTRRLDVEELEREYRRSRVPNLKLVGKVEEGILKDVKRLASASSNKLAKVSAKVVKSVKDAGYESSSITRDAMIGAVRLVNTSGSRSTHQFRNITIGLVRGVRDATGATGRIIHDTGSGAVQANSDDETRAITIQGVAQGVIASAPSIGVTVNQAIRQLTQGLLEGCQESEVQFVQSVGPVMKGIVAGTAGTGQNVADAVRSGAFELVTRAIGLNLDLHAVSEEIANGVVEAGRELSLEIETLSIAAKTGVQDASVELG